MSKKPFLLVPLFIAGLSLFPVAGHGETGIDFGGGSSFSMPPAIAAGSPETRQAFAVLTDFLAGTNYTGTQVGASLSDNQLNLASKAFWAENVDRKLVWSASRPAFHALMMNLRDRDTPAGSDKMPWLAEILHLNKIHTKFWDFIDGSEEDIKFFTQAHDALSERFKEARCMHEAAKFNTSADGADFMPLLLREVPPSASPSVKARRSNSLLRNDATKKLDAALKKLYSAAKGDPKSGRADLAHITTEDRKTFFRSLEFRSWVAAEKAQGKQVFWFRDMDKTQTAGDIFTFFFKWRAENGMITPDQNGIIKAFLKNVKTNDPELQERLNQVDRNDGSANGKLVIDLWRSREVGKDSGNGNEGKGVTLLQFWLDIFWPTQRGLTRLEKRRQVTEFAPYFASKMYPGVREENLALRDAGVDVVLVSAGDQELAGAVAPLLGIEKDNVVGSFLTYKDGKAVDPEPLHTYERFDKESVGRLQDAKPVSIHYWLNLNKGRWGWKSLETDKIVVGGMDGDSASTDGGMMTEQQLASAIGNFIIDTPYEPERKEKFFAMIRKYGYNLGKFITLERDPASPGAWEGDTLEFAPFSSIRDLKLGAVPTRVLYSVLNQVKDWTKGHTTVYAGLKRAAAPAGTLYSSGKFLSDLKFHVENTLEFLRPQGLLGYFVYATEEAEFAIMHWASEGQMNKAFKSIEGQMVTQGASRIFEPNPMVWEPMQGFTGKLTAGVIESYLLRLHPEQPQQEVGAQSAGVSGKMRPLSPRSERQFVDSFRRLTPMEIKNHRIRALPGMKPEGRFDLDVSDHRRGDSIFLIIPVEKLTDGRPDPNLSQTYYVEFGSHNSKSAAVMYFGPFSLDELP